MFQTTSLLQAAQRGDTAVVHQLMSNGAIAVTHQGSKKASKARLEKLQELETRGATASARLEDSRIVILAGPRLGNKVLTVNKLSKTLEDGRVLFKDLSFAVPPHAIVGIVGGNGTGKSTLFKIIAGHESPDADSVTLGQTASLGFVSQSRDELMSRRSVFEEISGDNELVEEKKVASLSGGERNRVHLAKMLLGGHNILLLDEPTNDLNVDTLRSLESALENFGGVSMVISHDRWFLDRICTHILAYAGDVRVVFFDGNYTEYEKDKQRA